MIACQHRMLRRRGISTAQAAVLLAVITLTIVAALRTLGTNARTNINTTAGNVANPATLPARFGS
jgi:Flp pilus assembly pilin Flp